MVSLECHSRSRPPIAGSADSYMGAAGAVRRGHWTWTHVVASEMPRIGRKWLTNGCAEHSRSPWVAKRRADPDEWHSLHLPRLPRWRSLPSPRRQRAVWRPNVGIVLQCSITYRLGFEPRSHSMRVLQLGAWLPTADGLTCCLSGAGGGGCWAKEAVDTCKLSSVLRSHFQERSRLPRWRMGVKRGPAARNMIQFRGRGGAGCSGAWSLQPRSTGRSRAVEHRPAPSAVRGHACCEPMPDELGEPFS